MASQRLVKYAEHISSGMDAKNAALKAGFARSTAARASVDLTPQAIRAGLLPDPDKRAELVAEFEAILADGLLDMARALVEKGERGNIAAIREVLDRYMGKVRQGVDVDATVQTDQTIKYKMKWPEEIDDSDG